MIWPDKAPIKKTAQWKYPFGVKPLEAKDKDSCFESNKLLYPILPGVKGKDNG